MILYNQHTMCSAEKIENWWRNSPIDVVLSSEMIFCGDNFKKNSKIIFNDHFITVDIDIIYSIDEKKTALHHSKLSWDQMKCFRWDNNPSISTIDEDARSCNSLVIISHFIIDVLFFCRTLVEQSDNRRTNITKRKRADSSMNGYKRWCRSYDIDKNGYSVRWTIRSVDHWNIFLSLLCRCFVVFQ